MLDVKAEVTRRAMVANWCATMRGEAAKYRDWRFASMLAASE
jgi:hypothetical protein